MARFLGIPPRPYFGPRFLGPPVSTGGGGGARPGGVFVGQSVHNDTSPTLSSMAAHAGPNFLGPPIEIPPVRQQYGGPGFLGIPPAVPPSGGPAFLGIPPTAGSGGPTGLPSAPYGGPAFQGGPSPVVDPTMVKQQILAAFQRLLGSGSFPSA